MEKLRNVVFVLVADELAVRLLERLRGPLVLDYQERDAIAEADNVAAPRLRARRALDLHLCLAEVRPDARTGQADFAAGGETLAAEDVAGPFR